jgi:lipid-binding SYLF domain-containing protein
MRLLRRCLLAMALVTFAAGPCYALTEQKEMVQRAHITVQKLLQSKDIGNSVTELLSKAKGVLIFPNLYKGAFLFGAEGGSGVLMAKGGEGRWSYPAFYFLGSGSFGLQFGAQTAEVMLLIMTERGLNAVLNQKVKIGADVNAAIGPYGLGAKAATTANLGADIFTYSLNQGAFMGMSVEGAIIYPRSEWTTGYYGNNRATPRAVVIEGKFANPHADALRESLLQPQ